MAVLLNAFGLSLNEEKHLASSVYSQSQSRSRVLRSGRERLSEEKLSFDPKPREYSFIAVDGSLVECRGPTAVRVGCCRRCNEATHLSGWVFHSQAPRRTRSDFCAG